MAQNNNILQELKELKSKLADLAPQNIYTVPVGYFDGLIGQVLNRIRAIEAVNAPDELGHLSPLLNNISRQMPYTVPAGYFDELSENQLQAIQGSSDQQTAKKELETLSPLLSGLKKEMPYHIPRGYFDRLGEKAIQPETKVISILSRQWVRYAAAAVVTGLIVLAGFMVAGNKENSRGQSLATFEKRLNKEIRKMSDKELDDFIQYTDAGLTGEEKVSGNSPAEIKDLLKDVPESELKKFLEETSDTETETSMTN